ncbi:MAG: superoxide dismutase [Chlorobi bacterium]|nr:superoxide dismutase [Chlorobiota bacterium]
MQRRDFIGITALGVLAACIPGGKKSTSATKKTQDLSNVKIIHEFPELPFAYNALEPYIDAKTVELHYDKHHRGYFKKFTSAIEGTELEQIPMSEIFAKISSYSDPIRNYGGGYYNHILYWENLNPDGGKPSGRLLTKIIRHFDSFDNFKKTFSDEAKTLFGSGWVWLIITPDNKLKIVSTPNQDNPLMNIAEYRGIPLLTIDIWEHSYYLKYKNKRSGYIDNFWNIVNWKKVNERLLNALKA